MLGHRPASAPAVLLDTGTTRQKTPNSPQNTQDSTAVEDANGIYFFESSDR